MEQFAYRVTDYSSQYGSRNGVSYTANNIVGPPSHFPSYGDFSETYVPVILVNALVKTKMMFQLHL